MGRVGGKGGGKKRGRGPPGGEAAVAGGSGGVFETYDEDDLDRARRPAHDAALDASGDEGGDDGDEALPADALAQLLSSFKASKPRRRRDKPVTAAARRARGGGADDAEGAGGSDPLGAPEAEAAAAAGGAGEDSGELVSDAGADAALGASDARYVARWGARWTADSVAAALAAARPSEGAPACEWSCALGQCARLGGGAAAGPPPPLRSIDELVLPAVAELWRALCASAGREGGLLSGVQACLGGWLASGCDVDVADLFALLGGSRGRGAYARIEAELMPLCAAYAADHVVRSRAIILKNSEALARREKRRQRAVQEAARAGGGARAGRARAEPEAAKAAAEAVAAAKAGAEAETDDECEEEEDGDSEAEAGEDGAQQAEGGDDDDDDDDDRYRDQGFSRPRVLFLLPFRHHAATLARALAQLIPAGGGSGAGPARAVAVLKGERLEAEYGDGGESGSEDESEAEQAAGRPAPASQRQRRQAEMRRRARAAPRPLDFVQLFGGARPEGGPGRAAGKRARRRNADDCFALGCRVSRRALRLFAPLSRADIILASPLGLAQLAESGGGGGGGGAEGGGGSGSRGPYLDCLSSVELCFVLCGSCLQMQNWAHVHAALRLLNQLPRHTAETDFSRVRHYALDGLSGALRQTLCLSEHAAAEVGSLLRTSCASVGGLLRGRHVPPGGWLGRVLSRRLKVVIRTFDAPSATESADARFGLFESQVLPALCSDGVGSGTLLFAPSYFDFVRLRNKLRAEGVEAAELSEYATPNAAARARGLFAAGGAKALLYSERAHFFHRHGLRGVRHLVFYGLPTNGQLFAQLADLLSAEGDEGGGGGQTLLILCCAYDRLQLERALGAERAAHVLESEQRTFVMH